MSIDYKALISGALGFTLALTWNDAIHKTIKSVIPPTDSPSVKAHETVIYAIVLTIIVVIMVLFINKVTSLLGEKSSFTSSPKIYAPPIVNLH